MDTTALLDARTVLLCGMLFSSIISLTAEKPAAVPALFQWVWKRYRLLQETRRNRTSQSSARRFWEIDMTKFEP